MSVQIHGRPAASLEAEGAGRFGRADARQGAFFETVTARALEDWLAGEPGHFHLFHDLTGLRDIAGHGYGPMGLGRGNIDHVILTGVGWVVVNAKSCSAGTLAMQRPDHAALRRPDGTWQELEWLNQRKDWRAVAIMFRLTGMQGGVAAIVPNRTAVDDGITQARCMQASITLITQLAEVRKGGVAEARPEVFARPGRPADPALVATLRRYLSAPDVPPRAGAVSRPTSTPAPMAAATRPTAPRYPWSPA